MTVRTLIALAGRAGAGKDTAAHLLGEAVWNDFPKDGVVVTGFARRMKRALEVIFDLNFEALDREEKEAKLDWLGKSPRELMQSLGTEWGRNCVRDDLWLLLMERTLYDHPTRSRDVILITDCRFPNEVAWVRRKGGSVWWIERDGLPGVAAHSSENSIGPADCDRTVLNFGTKEDLAEAVQRAWAQHVVAMEAAA